MWSNKCWVKGHNPFPWSGCAPAHEAQGAVGHPRPQGTPLAHAQHSASCLPGLPGPFLKSCSLVSPSPAYIRAQGTSFLRAGLGSCPCWISWSSRQPFPPASLCLPHDDSPAFEHEADMNGFHCSLPIHRSCHFIIAGSQVTLGKSMLPVSDHLHVPRDVLQEVLLSDFPGTEVRLTGLLLPGSPFWPFLMATFAFLQPSGTSPVSTTSQRWERSV